MATINNIKKRANDIKNAYEPESVTAEKVGSLFEDIANLTEQAVMVNKDAMNEAIAAARESAEAVVQSQEYLEHLNEAIENLPDGQAVSAQVAETQVELTQYKTHVTDTYGEYTAAEFLEVRIDSQGRILMAIKTDGDVLFGYGVPTQIQESILSSANTKVNKVEGKGLSTNDFSNEEKEVVDSNSFISNPEFLHVWTDHDNHIVFGLKTDGDVLFGYGVPTQIQNYVRQAIQTMSPSDFGVIGEFLGDLPYGDYTLSQLFAQKASLTDLGTAIDNATSAIAAELGELVDDIQPIEVTGDVTNAPDEEDLTSVEVGGTDVLRFKDKAHNSLLYSGLGRKYLRKNLVNGVNTLTSAMLPDTDTIYIVQYDYDLNNTSVNIPSGSVIKFEGGSFSNGTLDFSDTVFEGADYYVFKNVTMNGLFDLPIEAFGIVPQNRSLAYQNCTRFNQISTSQSDCTFRFKSLWYFFDALNPVSMRGRFIFKGEEEYVERHGSRWVIVNGDQLEEPSFVFTFVTDRTSLVGIGICADVLGGISFNDDCLNLGGVAFLDPQDSNISAGNIDSTVNGCFFYYLGCPVYGRGRGVKMTNSYFQNVGCCMFKETLTKSAESYIDSGSPHNQLPPFDGRDAWIEGNRFHMVLNNINFLDTYSDSSANADSCACVFLRNTEVTNTLNGVTYESTFHAVVIHNNYCDSSVARFLFYAPVNGLIFTGNSFVNALNSTSEGVLQFNHNVKYAVISDNVCTNYKKQKNVLVVCAGDVEDMIVSQNTGYLDRLVVLGGSLEGSLSKAHGLNVVANAIQNCSELIYVRNAQVKNLHEDNNAVSFAGNYPNKEDIVVFESPTSATGREVGCSSLHLVNSSVLSGILPFATNIIQPYFAIGTTTTALNKVSGTKAQRPSGLEIPLGFQYMQIDNTYGTFPIWASAISGSTVTWVKADGTNPDA